MHKSVGQIRIHRGFWLVVHVDEDLGQYYRDQFNMRARYKGFTVGDTKWGPHISIVRSEFYDEDVVKKFHETELEFEYTPEFRTNGVHVWFDVVCPRIGEIRKAIGLSERIPEFGAHLTLGVYHKKGPDDDFRIWIPSHDSEIQK